MRIEEEIALIEGCRSDGELVEILRKLSTSFGFSAFTFIDVGRPELDSPFVITTIQPKWESDYRSHGFVHVDPVLSIARRSNMPFRWRNIPIQHSKTGKKQKPQILFEAARDYGYSDGITIPLHYIDAHGIARSTCVSLFWSDGVRQLASLIRNKRPELHLLMLYWVQQFMLVSGKSFGGRGTGGLMAGLNATIQLTPRERDVLSWAGRGKTMSETGAILKISDSTVEEYLRQAMLKLTATNKTHAVAKALSLGLIDL